MRLIWDGKIGAQMNEIMKTDGDSLVVPLLPHPLS